MDSSDESSDVVVRNKSCYKLCLRFADKTSMQGVPYIKASRFVFAKVLWVILLLGAIGVMVFHLYYLCDQFFKWPKVTKIALGFDNLLLPAVTVCNINPIKRSSLHSASNRLQNLVERVDPQNLNLTLVERKKRFVDELEQVNATEYDDYDYSDFYDTLEEYIGEEDEVRMIEDLFKSLYMEENRDNRIYMGHNIEDMLVKCTFDGKQCDADNFTVQNTPDYGNCYTIQSDKFISKNSGPSSGLQLILFMENDEYLNGITQGYGARISVSNKDEIVFPVDDGIFVSTHTDTDIALKLVDITRLPRPHGKCEDGVEFRNRYKKKYTRRACNKYFKVTTLIDRCKCYDEFEAEILLNVSIKGKPCRSREEEKCMARVHKLFNDKNIKPDCLNPCSEIQYVKTLSAVQWPTPAYSDILKKSVCKMMDNCDTLRSYSRYDFSNNLVKVNIYFEDLNYEKIEESPEIENAQFLSDVGGAIGLWIGLSMLSMFEIVQLLIELCHFACYKCTNGNSPEKRDSKNKDDFEKPNKKYDKSHETVPSVTDARYLNGIPNRTGSLWKNDPISDKNSLDSKEHVPKTRYSRPSDYQYIDDYYIYKGKQNMI